VAYSSVAHMGFVTLGIFLFNLRAASRARSSRCQPRHHHRPLAVHDDRRGCTNAQPQPGHADNMGLGKYLPAFMGFWGLYALAPVRLPRHQRLRGEMLVFVAAFQERATTSARCWFPARFWARPTCSG
jgi:NADH-quinone oxidoreductase subunit M